MLFSIYKLFLTLFFKFLNLNQVMRNIFLFFYDEQNIRKFTKPFSFFKRTNTFFNFLKYLLNFIMQLITFLNIRILVIFFFNFILLNLNCLLDLLPDTFCFIENLLVTHSFKIFFFSGWLYIIFKLIFKNNVSNKTLIKYYTLFSNPQKFWIIKLRDYFTALGLKSSRLSGLIKALFKYLLKYLQTSNVVNERFLKFKLRNKKRIDE